ncbi:MAG: ArsR family transcriptional regulator [Thaumarchaeota archaeon]|nr:ArsR family transcriptional regulator [Nitrososphaerota archaeon]
MQDRTEKIIQLVSQNPGIRYSEIMRETGLKNGVLSHHLSKIEGAGKIIIERTPRVARIYPCGTQQQEAHIIKSMRNPTMKKIIISLLSEQLSFKQITEKAGKSQGTVSVYLKELTENGIVSRKINNNDLVFELADSVYVRDVISRHKTSLFERTADNISDIFSSI